MHGVDKWIQKENLSRKNWKMDVGGIWVGLMRVEKIMFLDWRRSEIRPGARGPELKRTRY